VNVADSHRRCIGLSDEIGRKPIVLEDHVFVGSHCFIAGGAHIGHHSVIAAQSIVRAGVIPPYSLVLGRSVRAGYYKREVEQNEAIKNSITGKWVLPMMKDYRP
jgi:acetyltransferase-like isoleucine patch superfamily enzyme